MEKSEENNQFHLTNQDIFTPAGSISQGMLQLIRRELIGDHPSTADIKTIIMTLNHIIVAKIVIYRLTTIPSHETTYQGGSQTESKEKAIIAILRVIIVIPVIIIIIMIIITILTVFVITMTLIILVIITAIVM